MTILVQHFLQPCGHRVPNENVAVSGAGCHVGSARTYHTLTVVGCGPILFGTKIGERFKRNGKPICAQPVDVNNPIVTEVNQ